MYFQKAIYRLDNTIILSNVKERGSNTESFYPIKGDAFAAQVLNYSTEKHSSRFGVGYRGHLSNRMPFLQQHTFKEPNYII